MRLFAIALTLIVILGAASLLFGLNAYQQTASGAPVDFLSAVTAIGAVVTAISSGLIALVAWDTASKFNEVQTLKFRVEHINEFNREIITLAKSNEELAQRVGKVVLPGSNITEDYLNFLSLNASHVEWRCAALGIGKKKSADEHIKNAAMLLAPKGTAYIDAILGRGYDPKFALQIRKFAKQYLQAHDATGPVAVNADV
jgi:hypothetical protein